MDNFFAEFSSPDSIFIMLVALAGFLIGFITAWLMWSSKANHFEKEAAKWKKSHDDLLARYGELKEEMELKEADLVKAQREAKEAIEIAKSLEAEKDKWQADLDAALEDTVKVKASIGSYQTTVEDLNNQIVGLKAMNADLTSLIGGNTNDQKVDEATMTRLNELEEKFSRMESEEAEEIERIAALEAKVLELEAENGVLQGKLKESAEPVMGKAISDAEEGNNIFAPTPETADIDKGETLALSAFAARERVTAAIGQTIPAATAAEKNDLTRIKGIGSFLEKKLNGLGIYTFEQISRFDSAMIENVTAAVEFFPGRIERDDWVGQATALIGTNQEVSTPPAIKEDNLKIVEGIGPKIEILLKDHGIPDLKSLAKAKEKRLREILSSAGNRYRIHDPSTWPEQAKLAAKGQLEKLNELQERLKGGREV